MKVWLNSLLASLVLLAACTVPNESAIHILQAHPLTPGPSGTTCPALTEGILAGSLDISATDIYVVQYDTENNLQQISTIVGPDTVAGPSRNTFFGTQLAYSYTALPPLPPDDELQPILFVLPPGATATGSAFRTDMITARMAQTLINTVGPGYSLQLYVTIQLQGALASGEKYNSNKVTFPIYVYNSGFGGCPAGDVPVPSGPCGLVGGQDGTRVACCKAVHPTPAGCPTGP